ncbi:hypothetical protein BCR43DRAFT_519777 [Syncephalastrum racemosum]|uniref:J domain-containing protein n=1 Tax=Syncephalastrum racemosum TaxID=13706 RepID=A0A1X2HTN0_SYNRA|nr:hypothetical protein BCR43DRAFT_519777 [Syncephalastrum racemosum]
MLRINHYDVLGVPTSASTEEIEEAYNECMDNRERLSRKERGDIKKAYQVLSDPKKREKYDARGASVADRLSGMFTAHGNSPASTFYQVFSILGRIEYLAPTAVGILFLLIVYGVLACIVLFIAYLPLKIEGMLEKTWLQVFTPLFVLDGILAVISLTSLCVVCCTIATAENKMALILSLPAMLIWPIHLACYVLFPIFIALYLDGHVSWSPAIIFAPYFVWEGINLINAFYSIFQICVFPEQVYSEEVPSTGAVLLHCISNVLFPVLRVLFVAFLLQKLAGTTDGTWLRHVFVPLYVHGALQFVFSILASCFNGVFDITGLFSPALFYGFLIPLAYRLDGVNMIPMLKIFIAPFVAVGLPTAVMTLMSPFLFVSVCADNLHFFF